MFLLVLSNCLLNGLIPLSVINAYFCEAIVLCGIAEEEVVLSNAVCALEIVHISLRISDADMSSER